MKNILIVDANYVASRAWYSTGHLQFDGKGSGMALGIIQTVEKCQEFFGSDVVVMAFDRGLGNRKLIYPEYKANRREGLTEAEWDAKKEYLRQLKKIPSMFKFMGYRNIFSQRGYEADDVIASVTNHLEDKQRGVIISADQDMWQLIRTNVICYDPRAKKRLDRNAFLKEWGVPPEMWPHVKALAGDPSDNIPGIEGIGLKTAAKYYRGELKEGSVARCKIEAGIAIHNRNLELVRLPLALVEVFELRPDDVDAKKRARVFEKLGAKAERWSR